MTNPEASSAAVERIVIDCVSLACGVPAARISLETDMVFGLGIAGDDGMEIISYVCSVTGASLHDYDLYQHFGPEAAFSMHRGKPLTIAQLVRLIESDLCPR
ncbi:MAG: hypothetical protein K2W86_04155 [Sphingomonas sp.]|uniref:hypothetical protein n=1 Tax=Sphingomonas sp. TaxID=28214 RepID=UPI0035A84720|nr:hypothetical protein [Sphingomonas sp.]